MSQVLLVDDDADASEAVAWYLGRAGHTVTRCPTGRDAMVAFAEVRPDLIVLDQRMPEMDGITFLGVLRNYYRGAAVPVVLLTADSDPLLPERAARFGVKRTFLKANYRLAELLACVNELTNHSLPDPASSAPNSAAIFPNPYGTSSRPADGL